MNVTIEERTAYGFTCPLCQWPGVAQTKPAAQWLARFHMLDVHGLKEEK